MQADKCVQGTWHVQRHVKGVTPCFFVMKFCHQAT